MSDLALKLDNVSKLYRLGEVGTGTLAHDLNRWWARIRGREDPTLAIGTTNNREETGGDYAWALKNINLEIKQGEILGIIGRNGAGKSTLLKLLSRVTAPTEGRIFVNGKMASLLEVGTGFHPELTGRENIYLNGAILGMSRIEVAKKFDEIVEFSGCQRYIDTPVKRYSSGMYVRLAFAVAAHLEPDILVVDEVLAVGDAEFQQKCLGKLKDVSDRSGRTVIFVSHNMAAISTLCPRSLLVKDGEIEMLAQTDSVVAHYLESGTTLLSASDDENTPKVSSEELELNSLKVLNNESQEQTNFHSDQGVDIEIDYSVLIEIRNLRIALTIRNQDGVEVFMTSDYSYQSPGKIRAAGDYVSRCHIPSNFFNRGVFYGQVDFEIPLERTALPSQNFRFEISELIHNQMGRIKALKPLGVVHPIFKWDVVKNR